MKYLLPILLMVPTHTQYIDKLETAATESSFTVGHPTRAGDWIVKPDIIICPNAPVRPDRVKQAVDFWKKLGYTFNEITVAEPNDFSCAREIILIGEIIIDLAGQDFLMSEHLAVTKTWIRKDTNEILKARIEIMSGWGNSERIMEHELGHALGWRDYNRIGHLMNSNWPMGGHDIKGLKL